MGKIALLVSGGSQSTRCTISARHKLTEKNACTRHKIEAGDLYNLVLKNIQDLTKTVLKDADVFLPLFEQLDGTVVYGKHFLNAERA